MIQYPFDFNDLNRQIDETRELRTWRTRARRRQQKINQAGKFSERSSIWSEIKPVFMRLQRNKCAFCERILAGEDHGGSIEHDLEHFRPKSSVKVWPEDSFNFQLGSASEKGYFWLTYDLSNYAVSCKKCNSSLKSNYFPIAGSRATTIGTVSEHNISEEPFLIFPFEPDDSPESLITFKGIMAVPSFRTGPRRRRAEVTIKFFELNGREELRRGRATLLDSLGNHLATINDPGSPPALSVEARRTVSRMVKKNAEHSSCVRALTSLYERDPLTARTLIAEARDYIESLS